MFRYIIKEIRIKHYIKNLLVFFPLIFSANIIHLDYVIKTLWAFCAFCAAASFVYVFNDIKDLEVDRLDDKKSQRPIAAGKISIRSSKILLITLLGITCFFAYKANSFFTKSLLYMLMYISLNVAYSIKLKHIPIIDIAVLTIGFIIRIYLGGAVINTDISDWLYLTVLSASLYFSLGKREQELKRNGKSVGRTVLKDYSSEFLHSSKKMALTLTIVFYALCITDKDITLAKYVGGGILRWSIAVVIFICLKYDLLLETNCEGDPVEVLTKSKPLLISTIGLLGSFVIAILIGAFHSI